MAMAAGADAVWVGTRFVCAEEAGAPMRHQKGVVNAGFHDTIRTIIYTGRPMRVLRNKMNVEWEENRQNDIQRLASEGTLPWIQAAEEMKTGDERKDMRMQIEYMPMLMGQCSGAITSVEPAAKIIDDMVNGAVDCLRAAHGRIAKL
jgi:NAD(P)H-dependent flavin oxidoreductase YrpB (nitropropane dioxygenase family)